MGAGSGSAGATVLLGGAGAETAEAFGDFAAAGFAATSSESEFFAVAVGVAAGISAVCEFEAFAGACVAAAEVWALGFGV